eukprot:441285_1
MAQPNVNKHQPRDIYVWNFWKTPIIVRVRADRFIVTEHYEKMIKEYYTKNNKSGSGGLKIGDFGVNASGSSEHEEKQNSHSEIKQKIEPYLNEAHFQIMNPTSEPCKFTLESESIVNYISIIVDGVVYKNNWNIGDREIIVEADGKDSNKVIIISNKDPQLEEMISSEKLFKVSYLKSVEGVLSNFRKLYDIGKSAEVDGQNVLTNDTINKILLTVVDDNELNSIIASLLSRAHEQHLHHLMRKKYMGDVVAAPPRREVKAANNELMASFESTKL